MPRDVQIESERARISRAIWGVFTTMVIMVATFLVWRYVSLTIEGLRNESYENEITFITDEVQSRVNFMVDTLYNLRGMITVGDVDSEKWRNYFLSTAIEDRYPDYFSFAYVDIVDKNEAAAYENRIRTAEKNNPSYKSFFVFPKTDNAQTYPIRLLHTFDQDISLLLGYDVGSSPAVSGAVVESVRTSGPVMSGLTYLKLVIPSSDKTGYVVAMPIYSDVSAMELSIDQRNRLLTNFVGVWIDSERLFGDLSTVIEDENPALAYDVYDGSVLISKGIEGNQNNLYEREVTLLNKNFRMVFSGKSDYKLTFFQENLPMFTLATGLVVILMWYGTLISILTARKRAEELANTATKDLKKFKMAVDGVSDHVIITDSDGTIIYANKGAERITGYSVKEMLGKRPSLWGGQMPEGFYEKMWKTIKVQKKPFSGQLTNKRKSGDVYEAEINISPILNEKGDLIYFIGIERDITRTKALDRMKTEFISLASHQLRTPLSAVKWFGRMLLAGDAGKLTKLQEEYIDKINSSNEREIRLVNSLLNISRIESGRISIVPKPTDMKELVENVVTDTGISEDKKTSEIKVDIEEDLPLLNIDPDLIRHVYMNLVTNAVRYSGKRGKVNVQVKTKGRYLFSVIEDSGIGIPTSEQGRIFDRFFRAANAMKRETEGTGLGLYLAKTIVESSGGKIWFKSKENVGTTFYFTLPLSGMKAKKGEVTLAK